MAARVRLATGRCLPKITLARLLRPAILLRPCSFSFIHGAFLPTRSGQLIGRPGTGIEFTTEIQGSPRSDAAVVEGDYSALSLTLLAVCLIAVLLAIAAPRVNAAAFATITGKGYMRPASRSAGWRWPVAGANRPGFLLALRPAAVHAGLAIVLQQPVAARSWARRRRRRWRITAFILR